VGRLREGDLRRAQGDAAPAGGEREYLILEAEVRGIPEGQSRVDPPKGPRPRRSGDRVRLRRLQHAQRPAGDRSLQPPSEGKADAEVEFPPRLSGLAIHIPGEVGHDGAHGGIVAQAASHRISDLAQVHVPIVGPDAPSIGEDRSVEVSPDRIAHFRLEREKRPPR
jgi:hypothetical protein